MKAIYHGQETNLDDEEIKGRDEFDRNTDLLEDTIEINPKDVLSVGENNAEAKNE